jgi:hypothetical protein
MGFVSYEMEFACGKKGTLGLTHSTETKKKRRSFGES